MSEKNKLIILATYWNEIDWIKSSLKQIETLNPMEVIICDGCFDPKKLNRSTDGTREVILEWIKNKDNVKLISAIRKPKIIGALSLLKGIKIFNIIRIFIAAAALRKNVYRINQALTFNYMISISEKWKDGYWFMTLDCDQFYDDIMIDQIKDFVNYNTDISLLTGNERTFFEGFEKYTEEYDKRVYNNMPHKIFRNTFIRPTREIIIEKYFYFNKYYKKVKHKNIGYYNHYKFKPYHPERLDEGYSLGDRKPPTKRQKIENKIFNEKHPTSINEML